MPTLRLIGDVHQRYESYLPLLKGSDYTLQVGDLGFDYTYLTRTGVDTAKHRAIGGNHDNYSEDSDNYFKKHPIFLGDYGIHDIGGLPIFYVRGAWSIDHLFRKQRQGWPYNLKGPVTWWDNEQLSVSELEDAIVAYQAAKPDFMVTHECPLDIVQYVTNPEFAEAFGHDSAEGSIKTRTNMALQVMFESHQPKHWFFGHYHKPWSQTVNGTTFTCIDMLRGGLDDAKYGCYDFQF